MAIGAAAVKELRERTGAGMLDCKKALEAAAGDLEQAIDILRKSGAAKAAKKAARVAAEGVIVISVASGAGAAAMVEVNCETDFVARGDDFKAFADAVGKCVLRHRPADTETLFKLPLGDGRETVVSACEQLVAKIGEKIQVRRFAALEAGGGVLGIYPHGTKIGVLVSLAGGNAEIAKDIAMHIAACRPLCVQESEVPADLLAREKEIFAAQAAETGKPPALVEKIVAGKLQKYKREVALSGQAFVKNPEVTVGKFLAEAGASVRGFHRFAVGEGIEKRVEN
ncbi:MAG: translation elongation factor Ts [Rhodospirillales bacterium]|nr:translation elongation factor Ts [Rhodospirillales bacterium]